MSKKLIKGISHIKIQAVKGKDGKDAVQPTDKELVSLITPLIPDPIKGDDGKDGADGIDGKDGTNGKDGKDGDKGDKGDKGDTGPAGSPDTPDEVVGKINEAKTKIDTKQVKGLQEVISEVDKIGKNPIGVASGGKTVRYLDDGTEVSAHVTELNFSTGITPVYDGNGRVTLTSAADGIFDKPDGPLVILAFGDSNTDGIGGSDASLLTQNSNVHVYATTGSGTWNPANLQWRDVNPNGPLITDNTTLPAGEPYVGILRNSNGSMGYTMADRLQRRTGRDVYLLVVHLGGVTSAYYQPGGGAGKEGMTALELYIPQALALIPGTPPTKFDYVMISLGGNDANVGVTPQTFKTNWETTYNYLISLGYIEAGYTQTFQMEVPHSFAVYDSPPWRGIELISDIATPDVSFLSSAGYDTSDTVHFVPSSMNSMGKISADLALLGKTRTRIVNPWLPAIEELTVPYTGATTDVDLGQHKLTARDITITGKDTAYTSFTGEGLLDYNSPMEVDYASAILPPAITFRSTVTFPQGGFVLAMGGLFSNSGIVKNESGTNATFGPFYTVVAQPTLQADNATVTSFIGADFFAQPTIEGINGGTFSQLGTHTNYIANMVMNAGSSVGTRTGFATWDIDPMNGTLTNHIGMNVHELATGTNRVSYLYGTSTAPAGLWGIYQGGTNLYQNYFNANLRRATVTKTGTYTATFSDDCIVATANTWTLTLPALDSTRVGTQFTISNVGTGTITVDGNSTDTINGATTVALTQYQSIIIRAYSTTAWVIEASI